MAVLEVRDDNFDTEVLQSGSIAVVDFWAVWCGPCRQMAPIVETISNEMTEIKFYKLNIDENQEIAQKYQVSSIPTLILYKGGEAKDRLIGAVPGSQVRAFIERSL